MKPEEFKFRLTRSKSPYGMARASDSIGNLMGQASIGWSVVIITNGNIAVIYH